MSTLRAGVALCSLLLGSLTCAPRAGAEGSPLQAWFPSALARAQHEAERSATQLAHDLELLPDVVRASVHLSRTAPDASPLDQQSPRARLSVVLVLSGPGPSDDEVLLLAQAASELPLQQPIALVRSREPSERTAHPTTTRVGPFEVLTSSAPTLRATLAASLLANVSLATILLSRRRRRRPRNQQN